MEHAEGAKTRRAAWSCNADRCLKSYNKSGIYLSMWLEGRGTVKDEYKERLRENQRMTWDGTSDEGFQALRFNCKYNLIRAGGSSGILYLKKGGKEFHSRMHFYFCRREGGKGGSSAISNQHQSVPPDVSQTVATPATAGAWLERELRYTDPRAAHLT